MSPTTVVDNAKDDYEPPIPALTFSVEDELTAEEMPFHSEENGRIVAKEAGAYICRLLVDPGARLRAGNKPISEFAIAWQLMLALMPLLYQSFSDYHRLIYMPNMA